MLTRLATGLIEGLDQIVEFVVLRNREYLPKAGPQHPDIGFGQKRDRDVRIMCHNKLPLWDNKG